MRPVSSRAFAPGSSSGSTASNAKRTHSVRVNTIGSRNPGSGATRPPAPHPSTPRVRATFSGDGGATFGEPVEIDGGNPAGRVDALLLEDGSALVSWLERTDRAAEVRIRRVWPDGRRSRASTVTGTSHERAGGFPRMARAEDGSVVFAWTDVLEGGSRVRVAVADLVEGGS